MSYIFYSPISKPFQETEEMLKYAKETCPSYITNDAFYYHHTTGERYYRFYFGNEKDYMLFVLRWS